MGKTKISVIGEEPKAKKPKEEKRKKVHLPGLKGGQRVVAVEAELPVESGPEAEQPKKKKVIIKKRTRGKRYIKARLLVDRNKNYSLSHAVKLVKETSISSFPGSVELHLITVKEGINLQVKLPYSTGIVKKVEVADEQTIKKIEAGKIDFDVLLATPQIMPKLIPYAKILGPKGLMPNPKNGTLVQDPEKAKENFLGNILSIKTERKAPLIHAVVAKINQPESEIEANIKAVIEAVGKKNIKKAVICATMGPAIKLAISENQVPVSSNSV
jgi:large subunit ribosomal protein L1